MRILCVTPYYFPAVRYGGPTVSVHSLNKALVEKGVDATVYTTCAGLEGEVPLNQEVIVNGVKVTYFSFSKFFECFLHGWKFSLRMKEALRDTIDMFDVVYVLVVWSFPAAAASFYCRMHRKPYIISPRGMLYPLTMRIKFFKKLLYYAFVTRRDLSRAAAIHYTSEDEQTQCHHFLRLHKKSFVVPNGIEIDHVSRSAAKEKLGQRYPVLAGKKIILFIGRITWKKHLDLLVKAYNLVARTRTDVHLLIVGETGEKYEREIKQLIHERGLVDRVTFAGIVFGQEKATVYGGSDVCVLPSRSENFGMTVVEAMMYGTPVVISDKVGIYKEVMKNKAGVVVELSPAKLCEGIVSVLDNEVFAQQLSRNGRAMVESEYAIDKVADRMIQLFHSVIGTQRC